MKELQDELENLLAIDLGAPTLSLKIAFHIGATSALYLNNDVKRVDAAKWIEKELEKCMMEAGCGDRPS